MEIDLLPRAEFTSQCWSPDGQRLVYHVLDREPTTWTLENSRKKEPPNPGTVFIYDIAQKKSREMGRGQEPTWSPDGEWIAYWNNGAYYLIPSSGGVPPAAVQTQRTGIALVVVAGFAPGLVFLLLLFAANAAVHV